MSNATRNDLLADLADAINELIEPRTHAEYIEVPVVEQTTTSRRRKAKRTKQRKQHVVTLPGLLTSLESAMVPGATGDGDGSAGFESRPSADLEPVAVLREIQRDAMTWARAFNVNRSTLADILRGLVSAHHTDTQLGNLVIDARRWVRRARLATGFDPAPITLNEPCPYCWRRHALVITGDLQTAKCTRCGVAWSPDTIGLLADMLHANESRETLTQERCWMTDCTRVGDHDQHQDHSGRTWRDVCPVDVRPAS